MEYGKIVLVHKHEEKTYLFRTNYTKQELEMVCKLSPEEYEDLIGDAAQEEYLYGAVTQETLEALNSYDETGYVAIDSRKIELEDLDKWSEQRKQYIAEMSQEHYEEEKAMEQYGY